MIKNNWHKRGCEYVYSNSKTLKPGILSKRRTYEWCPIYSIKARFRNIECVFRNIEYGFRSLEYRFRNVEYDIRKDLLKAPFIRYRFHFISDSPLVYMRTHQSDMLHTVFAFSNERSESGMKPIRYEIKTVSYRLKKFSK